MNPIKPGSDKHPTGQRLNISLAFADNKSRWQGAAYRINQVIARLPSTKTDVSKEDAPSVTKKEKRKATLAKNAADTKYIWINSDFDLPAGMVAKELIKMDNAVRYEYQVDAQMMDNTMSVIHRILVEDILSGSEFWTTRFFLNSNLNEASADGTTDSFDSAVKIVEGTSAEASLAVLSAEQQLAQPAYLDRLKLVNGRTFESMAGLTTDMKSQLRLTLTEGMARGVGIRDLKGMINNRLGVGMVRAERIARTEINNAYRGAYLSEAEDLNKDALQDDEWEIKQAHRSALSSTTRKEHARRHGSIFTISEQKDWWARNGNSINCLCSTLDVLVNKATGEVLQGKMIGRMLDQREQITGEKAPKVKPVKKAKPKAKAAPKPKPKPKQTRKIKVPETTTANAVSNIDNKFSNAQIFHVKTGDKEIMRRNMATFDQLSDEYNLSMPDDDFQALGINGNKLQPRIVGDRKVKAKRFGKNVGGTVMTNNGRRQLSVNSATIKNREALSRSRDSIFTKFVGEENMDIQTMVHEFGHLVFTPGYKELKNQKALDDWFNFEFKGTPEFHAYRDNARSITNSYNRLFEREHSRIAKQYRAKDITRDEYTDLFHRIDLKIKDEVVSGHEDHFISIYAYSNERELVAEAFADYKLSDNPAPISLTIGKAIDKFMRKKQ